MTVALDIGGANIKIAWRRDAGIAARSVPFALWKAPQRLAEVVGNLVGGLDGREAIDRVLVTMTAELCDCFLTKRAGVDYVLGAVESVADARPVRVWSTEGVLCAAGAARAAPLAVAAANWHAAATWLARRYADGASLWIDTGSTTTDIIAMEGGRIDVRGLTDTDRLTSGELLYLGAARTPIMALGREITWRRQTVSLAAELFANMADVCLLTKRVEERPHDNDTCDGRPFTITCAAMRLARMVGADTETLSQDDIIQLAHAFARTWIASVTAAIARVVRRRTLRQVIISGSGHYLASAAAHAALPGVPQVAIREALGDGLSDAICAVALLHLDDGS